ncbi:hypothetical protein RRG08_010568 [Elysia crispata]|uniref:Uncharacterized protein n=1 Tax=Elysia crispata TaxID=231223 RepID=A0AAE0ZTN6_9GAST|nr:hypothetical protein RRG08_010568 [Elysia crispata]
MSGLVSELVSHTTANRPACHRNFPHSTPPTMPNKVPRDIDKTQRMRQEGHVLRDHRADALSPHPPVFYLSFHTNSDCRTRNRRIRHVGPSRLFTDRSKRAVPYLPSELLHRVTHTACVKCCPRRGMRSLMPGPDNNLKTWRSAQSLLQHFAKQAPGVPPLVSDSYRLSGGVGGAQVQVTACLPSNKIILSPVYDSNVLDKLILLSTKAI